MGGINCIKLLSANKGLLKKAEHNLTTYSGHQELTQKNKISKVHFFVRHPVYIYIYIDIYMQLICNLNIIQMQFRCNLDAI